MQSLRKGYRDRGVARSKKLDDNGGVKQANGCGKGLPFSLTGVEYGVRKIADNFQKSTDGQFGSV